MTKCLPADLDANHGGEGPTSRPGAEPRTDARLLEFLVCPMTRATLEYDVQRQELISRRANLAYPIRDGVPLLTREVARNLDQD